MTKENIISQVVEIIDRMHGDDCWPGVNPGECACGFDALKREIVAQFGTTPTP